MTAKHSKINLFTKIIKLYMNVKETLDSNKESPIFPVFTNVLQHSPGYTGPATKTLV